MVGLNINFSDNEVVGILKVQFPRKVLYIIGLGIPQTK